LAYFNKSTVVGNDKTNDRVIYRRRTKPGEKYNKELLIEPFVKSDNWDFFDPGSDQP
jgi:outer membrane protein insertion porin family